MKYRGYIGHAIFDDKAKIFHGNVIGLKDVITFQSTSVTENAHALYKMRQLQ